MTVEFAKTYDPQQVQAEVAAWWQQANAFHIEPTGTGRPYVIVIPPPNVTAALHLGHALNNTLQDVLIRWRRMCGDEALWLPGTDHAGIATQTVVDKRLRAEGQPALADYKRMEAAGEPGRARFIEKVQAWKDEYESRITEQLKAMGCSCDWARQAFTMDDIRARSVREAFFRLFQEGLIYRGKRLVNWDPATQTALADDEVEMQEIDGHFWYLKYPIVDEAGDPSGAFATVATTRPETMLGDTAVAVNPHDQPRARYIGQRCKLPIVNRIVPIIADDYVVIPDAESDDPKARFASGFLKVTPAHDPNDWQIGLRHGLPVINVLGPDGAISDQHGWPAEDFQQGGEDLQNLVGMDRYEAREAIVDWFRGNGLLAEVRPYRHAVGHSYRSHVPIEPYLSDQWYVKVTDDRLAGVALRAMAPDQRSESDGCVWKDGDSFQPGDANVRSEGPSGASSPECNTTAPGPSGGDIAGSYEGQLRFIPARYARTFQMWHENIRDWCISRQLWWGHRIPVWRRAHALDEPPANMAEIVARLQQWQRDGRIVTQYRGEIAPLTDAEKQEHDLTAFFYCVRDPEGSDAEIVAYLENLGLERDPDVLDTWFSSALWPLSTLGWPDETEELRHWNPTSVLSTAREIITLWVSRMVMFNIYFRGCVPFREVFIHAMIQDGEGRKMSKSLGNGVDPLDIIDSHGADAMRFTLVQMTTNTQDVRMPVQRSERTGRNTSPKFDIGRNFCNKLWNAARFALEHLQTRPNSGTADNEPASLADRWIVSRLARTVEQVNTALAGYQFNVYAQCLYDFFWRDLCDWYLEAIKPVVRLDSEAGSAARATLATCLDAAVRLLHPIAPFITEKLFAEMNRVAPRRGLAGVRLPDSALCIRAGWPEVDAALIDASAEATFAGLQELTTMIREVRVSNNIAPRQAVEVSVKMSAEDTAQLREDLGLVESLTHVKIVAVGPEVQRPANAAAMIRPIGEVYLHQQFDAQAEHQRLTRRLDDLEKSRSALAGRLNNPGYVDKAPAHLVQQTRDQLAEVESELQTIRDALAALD